jgi:ketosteroid isomerase-like protein
VLAEVIASATARHGGEVEMAHIRLQQHRDGRVVRTENFPTDAVEEALGRFHELGAENAAFHVARRSLDAAHRRDWAEWRDLTAPDAVYEDKRKGLAFVANGAEAFIDFVRSASDVFRAEPTVRAVAARGERLSLARTSLGKPDASRWTSEMLSLTVLDESGRTRYRVIFDADDLPGAMAELERFERELGTATDGRALHNRAAELQERVNELAQRGDVDGLEALAADDVVFEDRRPTPRIRLEGKEDVVAFWKAAIPETILRWEPIAIRGEHLYLQQAVASMRGGFEVESISLSEFDESGRNTFIALFDPLDLDGAIDTMNERYALREGAPFAAFLRNSTAFMKALNALDVDALRELMTEDFVFADHRLASFGSMAREEWLGTVTVLRDLMTELKYIARSHIRITPHGNVADAVFLGRTVEDTLVDRRFIGLSFIRGDLLARIDVFDEDHLDDAFALFDELGPPTVDADGPPPLGPRDGSVLENRCTRVMAEQIEHYQRGDFDAGAELYADDFVRFDRTRALQTEDRGRDDILSYIRASVGVGYRRFEGVPIAIRGERLALMRWVVEDDTGLVSERLSVYEIGEEGLIIRAVTFDTADLDAAFDELDDRYIAGEGAPIADRIHRMRKLLKAHRDRDWDTWRESYADGFVVVDHRPLGWGEIRGVDEFLRLTITLIDVAPDARLFFTALHAVGRTCWLLEACGTGTNSEGGEVVLVHFFALQQFRDDEMNRMELFPLDQLDAAAARVAELDAQAEEMTTE